MKNSDSIKKSSRRQFTRTIVTAAVAAPVLASMASCKGERDGGTPTPTPGTSPSPADRGAATTGDCPCKLTKGEGFTEISFGSESVVLQDHIPPMRIEGGGSLVIDSRHKLKEEGTGTGPFTYTEDGVEDDEDRYGDIKGAWVITENDTNPFVKISNYGDLLPGAQLLLWYQDISASPVGDDDATYPLGAFPDGDPDVKVIGGRGANHFKIVVKKKRLDGTKSHKPKKPNRFTHNSGGALARHFRIGQWRIVNAAGSTIVGATEPGNENYTFFVRFGEFQP